MTHFKLRYSSTQIIIIALIIFGGFSCGEGGFIGSSDGGILRGNDSNPTVGQSGSFAQFTIKGDYFYSVLDKKLKTFKIGQDLKLDYIQDQELNIGVETIHPFKEYLLLGAESGVYIYKVGDNGVPSQISQFEHVVSCDPVVAEGDYAYVTLRTDGACRGVNRFDILDIKNIYKPKLVYSHNIDKPFGLAVENDIVFVCQGEYGVTVFDVSDKSSPEIITVLSDLSARDVILDRQRKIAMFMGYGELIQMDYSNIDSIQKISSYGI